MPHIPKVYGYCRLSKEEITATCLECKREWTLDIKDDEQIDYDCFQCGKTHRINSSDPVSVQAQTDKIMELGNTKVPRNVDPNVEILADIGVSGKIPVQDREQGGKLFQKLRGGDWLIVAKFDRLFRDLEDCCKQLKFFQRTGIHLLMGDLPELDIHSPMGEMLIKFMAIVAESERKRIAERTREGLAKRKALGLPVSSQVPRGYSLMCTKCEHIYHYEQTRKGQSCPGCKTPRRGNTSHVPNPFEQQIMWRLLWERSGYFWKEWAQVVSDLNADGIRTREGQKVNRNWAREYWYDALDLLCEEKLLHEHRPPKMENFSIHKIPHVPQKIAEKLEAQSRELGDK